MRLNPATLSIAAVFILLPALTIASGYDSAAGEHFHNGKNANVRLVRAHSSWSMT